MKRIMSILTLGFAAASLGLLVLACFGMATAALCAAAICWAAGFAWFVNFGRRAQGRQRYLFAAAFWVLCSDLLACMLWCGMVFLKK